MRRTGWRQLFGELRQSYPKSDWLSHAEQLGTLVLTSSASRGHGANQTTTLSVREAARVGYRWLVSLDDPGELFARVQPALNYLSPAPLLVLSLSWVLKLLQLAQARKVGP